MATILFTTFIGITFGAFIGMMFGALIALFTCDECYEETIENWNGQC